MTSSNSFLTHLSEQIQKVHFLKHGFYKAWPEGKLSYYRHVKTFRASLPALYAYEGQGPDIHLSKNDNLKKQGMSDLEHWRYFNMHFVKNCKQRNICLELQH